MSVTKIIKMCAVLGSTVLITCTSFTHFGTLFIVEEIGHFTVVYLVAKPLIWSEAEGDLVVLET